MSVAKAAPFVAEKSGPATAPVGWGGEPRSAEDARLVASFLAGRVEAFESIFRRHQDHIFCLCRALLGEREAAEDATQETFLNAYRGLSELRCGSSLSSWLRKIAVNVCLQQRRQESRRPCASLQSESRPEERVPALADSPPDHLGSLHVREVLAALPTQQRLVRVLRDVQGLSYEEISKATGWNLGVVKVGGSRARKAFARRYLEQE